MERGEGKGKEGTGRDGNGREGKGNSREGQTEVGAVGGMIRETSVTSGRLHACLQLCMELTRDDSCHKTPTVTHQLIHNPAYYTDFSFEV